MHLVTVMEIVKKAFTLVELMVVIAIVAVLSAIAFPAYKNYLMRGKMAHAFKVMSGYIEMSKHYFSMHGVFPNATELGFVAGSNPYDLADTSVINGANRVIINKFCSGNKGEVSVRFQPVSLPGLSGDVFFSMVVGDQDGVMITNCFYRSELTNVNAVQYIPASCQTGYPNADLTTRLCETPIGPPSA